MTDSYSTSMHELDDDILRLLPRDLLNDIGIVDPAEQHVLDAKDLAAHLASVLGGAPKKTPCHHPQVNVRRGSLAGGGDVHRVAVAVPHFLPAPAVPWQIMGGLRRNNMVLHPTATMPGLAPAKPLGGGAQPTATVRRGAAGTGVFLPRTEVVRRTAKAARSPSNGNHARIIIHQRVQQAAMVIVRTQQEMRAVAAHMERRYYLGVHPHPELALPQEWTY